MPASTRNRSIAGCELGNRSRQFWMDSAAVIALSEVLDQRLPVGLDVVNDRLGERQIFKTVAFEHLRTAEPSPELRLHLCGERLSPVVQTDPHVTRPLGNTDRPQAVSLLDGSGHLSKIGDRE